MENENSPPKLDLTRIDDFGSPGEPAGPDLSDLFDLDVDAAQPKPPEIDAGSSAKLSQEPAVEEPIQIDESPLAEVRKLSERLSVAKELVPAAYPFSVMIDGELAPEEKERLLDLLNRENLGIRPMDLEPQLEEGRILIPRVSEYAGVLIVQALRSSGARIRIGPSDDIYATDDTRAESDEPIARHADRAAITSYETTHAADHIPVTPEGNLPELGPYVVVDIVTASAALSVQAVEAVRSTEYQEILENLQRELRFKAWRKGATAVLNFSVQLQLLSLPSRYRVLVTGSAVRGAGPGQV